MENRPQDRPASNARIMATRVLVGLLLVLMFISRPLFKEYGLADQILSFAGLICLGAASFGRIWTSIYIAGYKNDSLITYGPYSLVRNPLYCFSFIGTVGVGLTIGSLLITVILIGAFCLYYPFVVDEEEKRLAQLYGDTFRQYAATTPKFIPNLSLFNEPEFVPVNTRAFRRSFGDATFFIWVYGLLELVERAHATGLLPVLFRIP
ncbi:MAG: methyltransferase family protein [Acidobacteriota bacterium]